MSQIEAVFFDCDGTLVDSEVICSRAYVTMFQEFGITLDPEEVFKRFKGVKLYEIIDIVSLEHGVTLAKTEAEHVYRAEVARLFDSELEAIEGAGCWVMCTTMASFLRQILVFLDAMVMNKPEFMGGVIQNKVDRQTGEVIDQGTLDHLTGQLTAFGEFIQRVKI
jgi:phosphoglycolate phosphatase-like HAD superfamily hydrolase